MFAFERRFHRGMVTLLVIQVILSFFTIYLLERMVQDKQRVPVEVDLGLRRSMNTLMTSLQSSEADFTVWNLQWSKGLTETGQLLHEAHHPVTLFLTLSKLDSRTLHQDVAVRKQAELIIMNLAKAYDSHWTQTQKAFRLTVIGGAWSVTLLSLMGFVGLAYVHSQIKRYLLVPLREICQCLIDWKQGNRLRRCSVAGLDPNVQRSLDILNRCLDEHRPLKVMTPVERHFSEQDT
ncbi:MAG TPA: hypothetical protein VE954_01370 [Oligoflexus sp.]|uniref:hypothetical protein n=1 Tax=Oligoflexus sp. TaxID=1971216 RepID=UPI002D3B63E4|nr:hypothetical protein [Oligoflexus sp.]HYX31732.1 hypothetical protein [Oligoflexus sp.]